MRILGIDVSHYQRDIRWTDVAASGVQFAFAKASENNTAVDGYFEKNWRQMQEAGLYRGAYHFGRPGGDPETQAVHFHSVVGPLGFRDLPPVLDLEVADRHDANHVIAWARAFLSKAETLFGRRLILYTGGFWKGDLKNPKLADFAERPLWLAAYQDEQRVVVPASWDRWTFWQYTDGTQRPAQRVAGVAPCDQNWFFGSAEELDRLAQGDSPAPPALPDVHTGVAWPGTHFVWPRTPAQRCPAIKAWQEKLRALGFAVDADGIYGPQSKQACLAFQREHGLVPDGIVGKATWEATFAA